MSNTKLVSRPISNTKLVSRPISDTKLVNRPISQSLPLLAFYGDDFTGSTDALEVLATHQLDTLLFLDWPDAQQLALAASRFAAIGIAGVSRAKGVDWMDQQLPAVYRALRATGAAICHYKVCSTFDSSPAVGNIGRALQLGRAAFGGRQAVPIVVGAPQMRRYTCFGQLFAGAGGQTYRIDRHPTMSAHPVTPMDEADLRLHLARQAPLRVGLLDIAALQTDDAEQRLAAALDEYDALLFDVLDGASQARVGAMLWETAGRHDGPLFCVGSSGVQYALVAHWASLWPAQVCQQQPSAAAVERIIAVSGSCSPLTAEQIDSAAADGFAPIAVDAVALSDGQRCDAELARVAALADRVWANGESPLLYTARGPDDPAIARLQTFIDTHRLDRADTLAKLGRLQGRLLRELVQRHQVARVAVAGGDTAGEVVQALELKALRLKARVFPGAPLCQAYAELDADPVLEIALKGGQMGDKDYFAAVRRGG